MSGLHSWLNRIRAGALLLAALLIAGTIMFSTAKPALDVRVGVVTNQFGFPVADLVLWNRSGTALFYQFSTEGLRTNWVKVGTVRSSGSLSPGERRSIPVGHPIPEGKWRIRIQWQRSPSGAGLYQRLRKLWPAVAKYFERESITWSESIEAWQPAELR